MTPMIIQSSEDVMREIKQYESVLAIKHKIANEQHYYILLTMNNLLMIAGQSRKDLSYMFLFAEKSIKPILGKLTKNYFDTKNITLDNQSINQLFKIIELNRQYWLRQTTQLFNFCVDELNAFNKSL